MSSKEFSKKLSDLESDMDDALSMMGQSRDPQEREFWRQKVSSVRKLIDNLVNRVFEENLAYIAREDD